MHPFAGGGSSGIELQICRRRNETTYEPILSEETFVKRHHWDAWLLIALVVAGVVCRLAFRGIPNFAPVAAIALFAGFLFNSRWQALLAPLAIMAVSDLFLGGYQWQVMLVVYGLLSLPVFFGRWLQARGPHRPGALPERGAILLGSSLASSILFFLGTNFAWWTTSAVYEKSLAGLAHCYAQALPFFRYTLTGDLFFATVLFGGYALVLLLNSQANEVPAPAKQRS